MPSKLNIIDAIKSEQLFGASFKDLSTWQAWITLFRAFFGLPMDDADLELYRQCTGRKNPPKGPFRELWCIVGRRGGKSFMSAVIAIWLGLFKDYRKYLTSGERGTVMIISADRAQSQVILRYVKGILHASPIFSQYIESELKESIDLINDYGNRICIEVMSCSYRAIRGRTVLAALLDEASFWRVEGQNPDKEVLAALRPSMASIPSSKLIAISSPYARFGSVFEAFTDYYASDDPDVLVWRAPTRFMNPTIAQDYIDKQLKKDPSSATAEYLAEFREDIESFLSREAVESCAILPGDLAPEGHRTYFAFVDPSGGKGDQFTLAIGYRSYRDEKLKTALLRGWNLPDPEVAVIDIVDILKHFRISTVMGDRYAAGWTQSAFTKRGIDYQTCPKAKSDLYLSMEGYVNSQRLEIPQNPDLIEELLNLDRTRGKSGKDRVDHPRGRHDDLANAVAGLCYALTSTESSYFVGCDLSAVSFEVKARFHRKVVPTADAGDIEIVRTVIGLAWPGERAGYAVVVAEGKHGKDRYLFLLQEIEELDSSRLIKLVIAAKKTHGVDTVYARPDPYLDYYNREAYRRGSLTLSISDPPELTPAGTQGVHIHHHLKMLKGRLEPGRKSLLIPKESRLPGYLMELTPDKAVTATDLAYPAIAAAAFAVSACDTWVYDENEQQIIDELNASLVEED